MTSSKERLRLAHQLLDRQLQNSTISKKSISENPDASTFWSFQGKKQSVVGKSDISDLQKKLMELEKKMENISCSSDPEDNDIFVRKPSKEKEQLAKYVRNMKKQFSSDEDSEDDNIVYAKVQQKEQKVNKEQKIHKQKKAQKPTPIVITHSQTSIPKPLPHHKNKPSLRDSIKSIKSIKSRKSHQSHQSNTSKTKKLNRSNSQNSIKSHNNSLNKFQIRQFQLENARDARKISNLQKQIVHYKRLCEKQKKKLEEYRVMEIQFKKLQSNFNKSQQVRKQQKKIIQSLKNR